MEENKGILYVMSTIVPGLIKVGRTDGFHARMAQLERNGYRNVTGLKREFAIEVSDYIEKEALINDIFAKSKIGNTELFSLDIDLMIQLLSSFEGKQVFPEPRNQTKNKVFENATQERKDRRMALLVPDGTYYYESKSKKEGSKRTQAKMKVEKGDFIIEKGSHISTSNGGSLSLKMRDLRADTTDKNGKVLEDVHFMTPSTAADYVAGHSRNGWETWKTKDGQSIDVFRKGIQ